MRSNPTPDVRSAVTAAVGNLAFIYHPVFDGRGFSRLSDSWHRYALARQLLIDLGLLATGEDAESSRADNARPIVECQAVEATDDELLWVHRPEHLAFVREADARGTGLLDYGDTPAWTGVLRRAKLAVGGTLLAARLVASGAFRRGFNPAGGLHHARADRAAGFCPFNDVAIAARGLQREFGFDRIAVVDLDGHHGDGTEAIFYDEPILTISMHRFGGRFYPGTGSSADVGRGAGFGYNLNVPLERGTSSEDYLAAFERWVVPALRRYSPRFIFYVVGADSHAADPLVRLGLTLSAFSHLARRMGELADDLCDGRLVAVAGGGYSPEHVARCWSVVLAILAGAWGDEDSRYVELVAQDRRSIESRSDL